MPFDIGTVAGDLNFKSFKDNFDKGLYTNSPADFINFMAQNGYGAGMGSLITFILDKILPTGDRLDVSYLLTDAVGFGGASTNNASQLDCKNEVKIRSRSVEAAFNPHDALPFVDKVLDLVDNRLSQNILIGGYLSLRVVGEQTSALLGMHLLKEATPQA
jgi:hypothetical protein